MINISKHKIGKKFRNEAPLLKDELRVNRVKQPSKGERWFDKHSLDENFYR
jgi:hypothetical protein